MWRLLLVVVLGLALVAMTDSPPKPRPLPNKTPVHESSPPPVDWRAVDWAQFLQHAEQAFDQTPLGKLMMDATWPLSEDDRAFLETLRWNDYAGKGPVIWISVDEQMLRVVDNGCVVWRRPCSTATNGVGSEANSNKTPLGWHSVIAKVGERAPWGQVFRSKLATHEVWQPGQTTKEDLVLTRILVLDGEEPGLNKGGSVDSFARCIYIHGTNDEARIGTPTSHGCIRLTNNDVIDLFNRMPLGAPVLITARSVRQAE